MKMWMYIVFITIALLAVLALTSKKSVHNEIIINADSKRVWSVLVDTESYNIWNPVMKLLEGEIKEGNRVKYLFTQDAETSNEIPSNVKRVIPTKLLNQGGGFPFILTFDHKYILEPTGNQTKVIIHEDYKGIGVHFWNPKPVEKAYERLNSALKERVESL